MAWIELHQSLWTHRKTFALADALDIDETYAAAHMARFWTWALDNTPDGDVSELTPRMIAAAAGWRGDALTLFTALLATGWLDMDLDGNPTVIHDWHRYVGKLVDARERERQRSAQRRQTADPQPVGRPAVDPQTTVGTVPNPTVPNRTPDPTDQVASFPGRTPRPRAGTPERKPLTAEQRAAIEADFADIPDLGEEIARALDHPSARKYSDMNLYVRGWLRRERAGPFGRASPGRNGHQVGQFAPPDPYDALLRQPQPAGRER